MVGGFIKGAAIAQARKDEDAAREHCSQQKQTSLRVAKGQVARAKQRHAESVEQQRQHTLMRNQELREASRDLRDYAKAMKNAQIKADSDRIQHLAEVQEQERLQRDENKRQIELEKAQRIAEVQANERAQKLRSERAERAERMKKEAQHRAMKERTEVARQARIKKEEERREARRLHEVAEREEAARRRKEAAEEFAREKAQKKKEFMEEKQAREVAKIATEKAKRAKAQREAEEAARQRAEAKAIMIEQVAEKKREQAEKKSSRLEREESERLAAIARAAQREIDLQAKVVYEAEMKVRLHKQAELARAKQGADRERMIARAKEDGARQIRNLKKLYPNLDIGDIGDIGEDTDADTDAGGEALALGDSNKDNNNETPKGDDGRQRLRES